MNAYIEIMLFSHVAVLVNQVNEMLNHGATKNMAIATLSDCAAGMIREYPESRIAKKFSEMTDEIVKKFAAENIGADTQPNAIDEQSCKAGIGGSSGYSGVVVINRDSKQRPDIVSVIGNVIKDQQK